MKAPGCTESSLSSEEQPVAGCWCRGCSGPAAPVTAAWRRRSSVVIPAPHLHDPGHGQSCGSVYVELNTAHSGDCEGIYVGNTSSDLIKFNADPDYLCVMSCLHK